MSTKSLLARNKDLSSHEKQLEVLNFSCNRIKIIPSNIKELTNLTTVNLNYNQIIHNPKANNLSGFFNYETCS